MISVKSQSVNVATGNEVFEFKVRSASRDFLLFSFALIVALLIISVLKQDPKYVQLLVVVIVCISGAWIFMYHVERPEIKAKCIEIEPFSLLIKETNKEYWLSFELVSTITINHDACVIVKLKNKRFLYVKVDKYSLRFIDKLCELSDVPIRKRRPLGGL